MGHDDTLVANGQPAVGLSPQKAVESDEYVFPHIGFNDFGPMGGYIETFQTRIDDITILLRVGPLAKPCILEVGALGDKNILADVGIGLDYGKSIQRRVTWNRNGFIQINDIKNTSEVFFAVFHKINEQSLRGPIHPKTDVWIQSDKGMAV